MPYGRIHCVSSQIRLQLGRESRSPNARPNSSVNSRKGSITAAPSNSTLVGSQRSSQVDFARVTKLNYSGALCVYIAEGLGLHRATR